MFDTLTIGGQGTSAAAHVRLEGQGIKYGYHAPGYHALDDPRQVYPLVRTANELGLPHGGFYQAICEMGLEAGYTWCPPDVGPAARLAYQDQEPGLEHNLYVAMYPLPFSEARKDGSQYERMVIWALSGGNIDQTTGTYDGKRWLHGRLVYPGAYFPPHARFLFLKK